MAQQEKMIDYKIQPSFYIKKMLNVTPNREFKKKKIKKKKPSVIIYTNMYINYDCAKDRRKKYLFDYF